MLFELKLAAASWTDQHPHSEYNFVIEGQLFVECGGVTLKAQAGDASLGVYLNSPLLC